MPGLNCKNWRGPLLQSHKSAAGATCRNQENGNQLASNEWSDRQALSSVTSSSKPTAACISGLPACATAQLLPAGVLQPVPYQALLAAARHAALGPGGSAAQLASLTRVPAGLAVVVGDAGASWDIQPSGEPGDDLLELLVGGPLEAQPAGREHRTKH